MKRLFILVPMVIVMVMIPGCWRHGQQDQSNQPIPLELISASPVNVPYPLEPSGLTLWKGSLYTVADKDSTTIYRVDWSESTARLMPAIRFQPPSGYYMDWEGICCDPQGNFYLISEQNGRILKVQPDGNSEWSTPDLRKEAMKIGLFAKSNAGFEGIAWLGPDHWMGAVEREPRGLVESSITDGQVSISPSIEESSPFSNELNLLRIPDYSALHADGESVYALFRNAHLVVKLQRSGKDWEEVQAWSYRHIETDPEIAYQAQTYGQAEGLVVDGSDVYLIFDNNLGGRQSDPNDGRPLIVHARMPEPTP